ncbi:MAG: DUF1501 domain-containing protein [Planctomycetales bacterium]|nr:DUF1501 domain-containing protein [Planctomycetales bacterium]
MPAAPLSRRQLLRTTGCGFGALALQSLAAPSATAASPLEPKAPMFRARAKRVIFILMHGGPSHVDSFDYKPELIERDGQSIEFTGVRFNTFGKKSQRTLMKPLWKFQQYGQCGQHVSELFPNIAEHVDDLCFLHGMHTEGVAHGPSTLFLHCGATNLVRPSVGSWVTYGLGTENQNLPGFVTICPSSSKGGPRNYGNAFLPAIYQGTTLGRAMLPATEARIRHLTNERLDKPELQRMFDQLQALNRQQVSRRPEDDELAAVVESYELAFRMQMKAPETLDLSRETPETLRMYGMDESHTENFGRQCLMARRLAEAGVRYIQVNYSDESPNPRWDQHSNMPKHMDHARATDKPVAGLLADLKRRGLLDDTLVWWGGEFGRTPFNQSNNGRDHNPRGFTVFLAGGGVKAGFRYGATDEIGDSAVEGRVHMRDLHATILHLLGMDHERLTYRYAGRDFRLTDIAGRVVKDIIA